MRNGRSVSYGQLPGEFGQKSNGRVSPKKGDRDCEEEGGNILVRVGGGISERPVFENCNQTSKDATEMNNTIYLNRSLSDDRFQQGKLHNKTAGKKTPFKPGQTSVKAFREAFFDNRFFNQQKNPPDAPESIKIEDSGRSLTEKPTKSSKKITNGSIFRSNSQNRYNKNPEESPTSLPFKPQTNFYKNFLSLTSNKNCQNPNNRCILDSYNCDNGRGGILVTQDVSLNYNSVGSIIENDFLNNQSNIDLTRLGYEGGKADSQFFINKTNILNNLLKNSKA
jgi:hypothetical protein